MFKKILIANRGEIACRIAKTARKLGVRTVGVYSEADKNSKHTQMMDEAYLIGPPQPSLSYLKIDHILDIAHKTGAQAIHPGYGFLSENAGFVKVLEDNDIKFVGPPASAIEKMGSKSESKFIMDNAKVPIVKGYHGDNQDPNFLLEEARKIGFPVMLKASLGGGGKGMRIVMEEREFFDQLDAAKREGMKSFSDDHMLIEKYIEKPRHIEVQVFGDQHGNYVHLNERDCSVQRRHQKVVEEAPSNISQALRNDIGQAAVMAAQAVGYYNAGTVEFIFDTTNDKFYFMEMNTRLQVEHPVTELVTGMDLVEWQLKVASGQTLPIIDQKKIPLFGHAMEARIYSEDPDNNFLPGSGHIKVLREPAQLENEIRIDTGVRQGDTITTFYDPMISKLIVHAEDRESAIRALYSALNDYKVVGLPTNIKFLKRVLLNKSFRDWDYDTSFIALNEDELIGVKDHSASSDSLKAQVAIANVWLNHQRERTQKDLNNDPWRSNDNFRLNNVSMRKVTVQENDEDETTSVLHVQYHSGNTFSVYTVDAVADTKESLLEHAEILINPENQDELIIRTNDEQMKLPFLVNPDGEFNFFDLEGQPLSYIVPDEDNLAGSGEIRNKMDFAKSPMPGTIVKTYCEVGQRVLEGEPLISLESMKMEFMVRATHDVTIQEIRVNEGEFVQMGERMIIFEPTPEE